VHSFLKDFDVDVDCFVFSVFLGMLMNFDEAVFN